jgi:hypothetical protein
MSNFVPNGSIEFDALPRQPVTRNCTTSQNRIIGSPDPQQLGRVPAQGNYSPFGGRFTTFLLLATPAVTIGFLILRFGVDTLWGDQWDGTLPLFEKMQAGTLGLADFFVFHSEHRIFFPRLLAFGLAKLTHWNVRAELLTIWILACICSLNLWRLAQLTISRSSRGYHWLLLATNVLLFTPLQGENFLWGFQITFLLPLVCLTACVWTGTSLKYPFDFLTTLILCLIATFSVASGFACWLLTAPLLLYPKERATRPMHKLCWSVWVSVAAASICICFRGFKPAAGHPSLLEALKNPLGALQFVLAYLGNPFSLGTALEESIVAQVTGLILIMPFVACLLYLWRWRRDRALLARSLPWVSLTGWAFANAFLTTLGRLGFGLQAAIQSRYVSFAMTLPIGLIFLVSILFKHWCESTATRAKGENIRMGLISFATAFALLLFCGAIRSLIYWRGFQHDRLSGKAALLLINVIDNPEALIRDVHHFNPGLRARTNFLNSLGYLRPPLVRSNHIRDIAYRSDADTVGQFEDLSTNSCSGEFTATGWAILPEKNRVADSVLLTYANVDGEPIIFALTKPEYRRETVSRKLGNTNYLNSGWKTWWKVGDIPATSRWISAWAFDAEDSRAFRIGGFFTKPR